MSISHNSFFKSIFKTLNNKKVLKEAKEKALKRAKEKAVIEKEKRFIRTLKSETSSITPQTIVNGVMLNYKNKLLRGLKMDRRKYDRRSFVERRRFSYSVFCPERRLGSDRRQEERRLTG